MRKITCLAILCALLAIAAVRPCFAQGLTIDQFGAAGALSDSDLIGIEQGGAPPAVKTTLGVLRAYITAVPTPAFYVSACTATLTACSGQTTLASDSNAGTLAAPFATLGKCQTTMRNNSIKVCYLRNGTYNLTAVSDFCGAGGAGQVLEFIGSDNGETWGSYPPDGYGSAILAGGAVSTGGGQGAGGYDFACVHAGAASMITFNGLQIQNFYQAAIYAQSPITVINNTLHDFFVNNNQVAAVVLEPFNSAADGSVISHNYIYNSASGGVAIFSGSNNNTTSNLTIANNFIYNTCISGGIPVAGDCGAIYFITNATVQPTNINVTNNFIRDVYTVGGGNIGASENGTGIYADDGASNINATGNVVTGLHGVCYFVHGGGTDTFKNNICDMTTATGSTIYIQQQSSIFQSLAGTGNTMTNNINTANSTTGESNPAYNGIWGPTGTMPGATTVNDNSYWNFGSGGNLNHACSATNGWTNCTPTGNADATPTNQNPLLHCWGAILAATSPALNSPTSYPAQPSGWDTAGFWGPPGFTIPHTGNAPSWSTASGDGVTCTATN